MRVKKWREEAQPEWPEPASGTQAVPAVGAGTQTFPETGAAARVPETRSPETRSPDKWLRDAEGAGGAVGTGGAAGTGGVAGVAGTGGVAGADRGPDFPGAPRADRASGFPEPPGRKPAVRDPWEESGTAGQNHDPDEVTVQLDGGSADNPGEGKPAGDGGSEGSDGPVFVDESGRRSRRYRRIGFAVGIACAVYAVVIVVTLLSGNSNAPWVPMTGPKDDTPAGKVDTSPAPAESTRPSAPVGVLLPGVVTPTVRDGVTPAPAISGTAPRATASPGSTGAPVVPSASATQPGGNPSASTLPSATPTQSANPPVSPTPTPPPVTTSPDPSVAPSETTGGGSAGPGTVADGPAEPSPVASETAATGTTAPAAPPDVPPAPSPEHIL